MRRYWAKFFLVSFGTAEDGIIIMITKVLVYGAAASGQPGEASLARPADMARRAKLGHCNKKAPAMKQGPGVRRERLELSCLSALAPQAILYYITN